MWNKAYLEEISTDALTEITALIKDVGRGESHIESSFNVFSPSTVSITVWNREKQAIKFLANDEASGLFDKLYNATAQGYRIVLKKGVEGAVDELVMFDGQVDIGSIKHPDRETVVFTATGWLADAGEYDAGVVSDPENPPLHNITGLDLSNPVGDLGGKDLQVGAVEAATAEHNERKFLSYCGGEKQYIPITSPTYLYLTLYEPNNRGHIDVRVTASLVNEDKKDYFSVREYEGALIACGWYEHRSIKEMVNHLLDAWWGEGVGTRDIQVDETPGGTPQKQFVYFAPFIDSGNKEPINITASRVIDYNDTTKKIKMLVAVEWKKESNNKIYLVEFDLVEQTRTVQHIVSGASNSIWRVAKFINWRGDYYAVAGSRHTGAMEEDEWWAEAFWKLDLVNYNTSHIVYIPSQATLPSHWFNLYSISAPDEGASAHTCYALQQLAFAGIAYTIELDIFDIDTKEWHYVSIAKDNAYAYQRATYGIRGTSTPGYYFAYKLQDGSHNIIQTMSYVNGITLSSGVSSQEFLWTSKIGTVVTDFYWHKRSDPVHSKTFFRAYDDTNGTKAKWIRSFPPENVPNGDEIRYMGGNELQDAHYTAWKVEAGHTWKIQSWEAYFGGGGNVQNEDGLMLAYFGDIDSPHIFKTIQLNDYYFCGFVTDKNLRIYPYVYVPADVIYSTIKEADFTNWTIWNALKYIAEAFLCYFFIPEYQNIRFYNRNRFNGTLTIKNYRKPLEDEIYKYFYDGIHIENSKYGLSKKLGNCGKKARVFHIDNRLISEDSISLVAQWYYNFFCIIGRKKLYLVIVPFLFEAECMDKAILQEYDLHQNLLHTKNTIVYEASFSIWRGKEDTNDIILRCLEYEGGGNIHELKLSKTSKRLII